MRILAVDDDQNVLDILQAILSTDVSLVLELVSSPQAALQAVNGHIQKFDCILLDIMMPEMDGITLCQKIRASPRYRDTPIVMLTAKSDKMSIRSAFSAGATDFVSKPFDIHEVTVRIRLAKELNSARNEIRALRCRAKIEKRRIKAATLGMASVALNETQGPHDQEVSKVRDIAAICEGHDYNDCLTRSEVIQLFSEDLSQHRNLHRRREKKRAC